MRRERIRDCCLGVIQHAQIVFAWLDRDDCYGTIAELGYAHALGKQIWIAYPREPSEELWFALSLANQVRKGRRPWIVLEEMLAALPQRASERCERPLADARAWAEANSPSPSLSEAQAQWLAAQQQPLTQQRRKRTPTTSTKARPRRKELPS